MELRQQVARILGSCASLAGLVACGNGEGTLADDVGDDIETGQVTQALADLTLLGGFSTTWTQIGTGFAKVAACERDKIFVMTSDRRLFQRTGNVNDPGTFIETLPPTQDIACTGPFLYRFDTDKNLYFKNLTAVNPVWSWVGRPTGAEHISGGYYVLQALNFDKTIWTQDGQTVFVPGADGAWTFRQTDNTAVRLTGAEAHPSGTPRKQNYRSFMLRNNGSLNYKDDLLAPSATQQPWKNVFMFGPQIAEFAASDPHVLYAIDTSQRLFRVDFKETSCYDGVDNDNDATVDEKEFPFCKDLPGDPMASTPIACNTTNDTLTKICQAIGFCDAPTRNCSIKTQELFAGTKIETAARTQYSGFGGSGRRMAEEAFCMMRDLRNIPQTAALDLGARTKVWEKVGITGFNPSTRTVSGYRRATVELPAFGKVDARPQLFTAILASTPNPTMPVDGSNLGMFAGDYRITEADGLAMAVDSAFEKQTFSPPAITVVTPYGAFKLSIYYEYTANNPVIGSPFAFGSKVADEVLLFPPSVGKVRDLYGRSLGALVTDGASIQSPLGGWDSQLAFGSRSGADVWTGGGPRPDLEMAKPRSGDEGQHSVQVRAGGFVNYDPKALLPAELRDSVLDIDFNLYFNPEYTAQVGSQLMLYFDEVAGTQGVENRVKEGSNVFLRSAYGGMGKFSLKFGLDLRVKIPMPFVDDIVVIDYHDFIEVPLSGGSRTTKNNVFGMGLMRNARNSGTGTVAVDSEQLVTPTGQTPVNPQTWIDDCLREAPSSATIPDPTYTPGNPNDVMPTEWPCNVCVWKLTSVAAGTQTERGPITKPITEGGVQIFPSANPTNWKCDSKFKADAGCMDLCSYDPVTKKMTVVKPAGVLIGNACIVAPVP